MLGSFIRSKLPEIELALAFTAVAFLFSLIGFVHPEPAIHYHEYSFPALAQEVLGHFSFGFLAAVPFLDFGLGLMVGSTAVFIDVDHLLAALGFAVSSRPDHSIVYAVVASISLVLIAGRVHLPKVRAKKAASAGFIVVLSHIAYDIFSATYVQPSTANSFPLFIPFSFQTVGFTGWYWLVFESTAVAVSVVVYFTAGSKCS